MCDDVIARVFMCACAIVSASCVTEEVCGFRLVRSLYTYHYLAKHYKTGFCTFDNGMMESECIDKEGRGEWCDELDSRMEQEHNERHRKVVGVDVNMLQVRQNAILKHLQMVPHEDILPFEFKSSISTGRVVSCGIPLHSILTLMATRCVLE